MSYNDIHAIVESFDDITINGEKVLSYFLGAMSEEEVSILKLVRSFSDRKDKFDIECILNKTQDAILVVETALNTYRFFAKVGTDVDFASNSTQAFDLITQELVQVDVYSAVAISA